MHIEQAKQLKIHRNSSTQRPNRGQIAIAQQADLAPVMRTLAGNFGILEKADLATAEIAVTELVVGALLGETPSDADWDIQRRAACCS